MEIYSYNNHRSAPFSRACWLVLPLPTLLGRRSRHCHGINFTQNASQIAEMGRTDIANLRHGLIS
jgi:hypothetical protein